MKFHTLTILSAAAFFTSLTGLSVIAQAASETHCQTVAEAGYMHDDRGYCRIAEVPDHAPRTVVEAEWSSTAKAGYVLDDGRYVRLVEKPYRAAATVTETRWSTVALPGYTNDGGRYVARVEVHRSGGQAAEASR